MDTIKLVPVSAAYAQQLEAYRAAFPSGCMQATPNPEHIPGLDGLDGYSTIEEWLGYCRKMTGKISWFLSIRQSDHSVIGALSLRHDLRYDDDDPDFASHIGYSIHPGERRKGYGRQQLLLGLKKAREVGLDTVRIICRDSNTASSRTILSCGGVYVDTIYGEESGMRVLRYEVKTEQPVRGCLSGKKSSPAT